MNSPGVQSHPKISPLAQNSTNGGSTPPVQTSQTPQSGSIPPPPPPPSMGSLAMGMPFQVFPTGPAVKNNQQLSAPQTNGNNRKSPQAFEPPPMGCRPEIKIPPNPMANLRPAPRPQVKGGDFWVEEYVQEKARNSIPSEDETRQSFASSPIIQQHQQQQQQPKIPTPPPAQKQQSPVRFVQRSPSPPEQRDYGQIRNVKLEDVRTASPVQANRSSPVMNRSPVPPSLPSPLTPTKTVTMEPIQTFNKQPQSYQQQMYQQTAPSYQPAPSYQQPTAQVYQPPVQCYTPPAQNYQQPTQGGRIILSTMPNRQQQAPPHVSCSLHSASKRF